MALSPHRIRKATSNGRSLPNLPVYVTGYSSCRNLKILCRLTTLLSPRFAALAFLGANVCRSSTSSIHSRRYDSMLFQQHLGSRPVGSAAPGIELRRQANRSRERLTSSAPREDGKLVTVFTRASRLCGKKEGASVDWGYAQSNLALPTTRKPMKPPRRRT